MSTLSELVAQKEQIEAEYLGRPGVTGVDVGYKEVGGRLTDQLAIRIHVKQKRDRVAAAERVPADLDGTVTDVLERDYEPQVASKALDAAALADSTHYPQLEGGISMGPSRAINGYVFAGTLGAIVIDNATNQHAALTNFHVACVDSSWHAGDRMVQPSRMDTGVPPGDEFGAIMRATLSGAVDGALVSIDAGHANACRVAEIGDIVGTKAATLGTAVRKRGRTTGLTYGTVDGISGTVTIDYGDGIGSKTLTNQVSVKADTARNAMFSDHGDSGSVIVDDAGYVVALLFAGAGTGTVGNQIASVLAELNIAMCVGKLVIKDLKDGHKDFIKDKEIHKEFQKEFKDGKEIKEKEKEFKELKELRKEHVNDGKVVKDIVDTRQKRIGDIVDPPRWGDLGPDRPGFGGRAGPGVFDERLRALEDQLANLASFIGPEQRPDLRTGAFSGETDLDDAQLAQLRGVLEQQAADAAAAKSEFDGRWA